MKNKKVEIKPEEDSSGDLDKTIVLNYIDDTNTRSVTETVGIILTILLLIILSIISLWLFVFDGLREDKETNKEPDTKEEQQKEKEEVIYKTSITGKDNEEIYNELINSTTKYSLNSINGTNDDIVINTFKYLAAAYTSASLIKDGESDYCLTLSSYKLNNDSYKNMALCLSGINYKVITEKIDNKTSGNPMLIITQSETDKIFNYSSSINIPFIKDYCSTMKLINEECDDEDAFVISQEKNDNLKLSNAVDVKTISKINNKYKVVLNEYVLDSDNEITINELIINASVADNHVVFD
jgi:hypothetical protein